MKAKEWLDLLSKADNYIPEMTPVIEKYGEMILEEYKKENEEKLWEEVEQILGNNQIESLIKMEKLLEKFEIRRK